MAEPNRVATHTQITDHVAAGLLRVMETLRSKPRVAAWVAAYLAEVQAVEDALWALFASSLATATGAALDQLGALLGLARGAMTDDAIYRAALRAVARARRSSSTAADLTAVAALLFGASPSSPPDPLPFTYREGGASVAIEPHEIPAVPAAVAAAVLALAKAAGVQLAVFDPPAVEGNLFAFSTDPLRPLFGDASAGLSTTGMGTGGQLTGVTSG